MSRLAAWAHQLTRPVGNMRVDNILAQFGTCMRREAAKICREWSNPEEDASNARRITLVNDPGRVLRPSDKVDPAALLIDGAPIPYAASQLHLVMNKPPGLVCTHAFDEGPTIYSLLPSEFLLRMPSLETIGRLDRMTSGLLLLTQDGLLNTRLCSPDAGGSKVYLVALDRPLRAGVVDMFASGRLQLVDGSVCRPALLEPHKEYSHVCSVTLGEGRHHQIRRMFAECGHTVTAIHRTAFAGLNLSELGISQGQWRFLTEAELLTTLEATERVGGRRRGTAQARAAQVRSGGS